MSGGWLGRGLVKGVLLDNLVVDVATAAGVQDVSDQLVLKGGGEHMVATMEVTPVGVNAAAYCNIQIETQLPNGDWHRVCRFARVAASAQGTIKKLFYGARFNNDSIVDIDNELTLALSAATETMIPLTGPVRARYFCGRGSSATFQWTIRVAVAVILRPEIST